MAGSGFFRKHPEFFLVVQAPTNEGRKKDHNNGRCHGLPAIATKPQNRRPVVRNGWQIAFNPAPHIRGRVFFVALEGFADVIVQFVVVYIFFHDNQVVRLLSSNFLKCAFALSSCDLEVPTEISRISAISGCE